MRVRIALGAAGVLLGLFGVFRLLTQIPGADLLELLVWLAAAVVLHDGVLAPIVVAAGWVIATIVPPRGRRYLQGGLIAAAMITVIGVVLIDRQGTQPEQKALLRQDYTANLLVVLAIVAAVSVLAYLLALVRTRQRGTGQRVSVTNVRPDDVQDPSGS